MKLWLLRPIKSDPKWKSWYDKAFGFVVRAETETSARILISQMKIESSMDEDGIYSPEYAGEEGIEVWLDPLHSTCVELKPEGEPEVILRDFRAA